MDLANIMLFLGGDPGQEIPKNDVTPSEIAVLRLIHGQDAVHSIVKVGTVSRTSGQERQRLVQRYGRGMNGEIRSEAVDRLFPGVAARLYERLEELEETAAEAEFDPLSEKIERIAPAPIKKSRRGKAASEPASEDEQADDTSVLS